MNSDAENYTQVHGPWRLLNDGNWFPTFRDIVQRHTQHASFNRITFCVVLKTVHSRCLKHTDTSFVIVMDFMDVALQQCDGLKEKKSIPGCHYINI